MNINDCASSPCQNNATCKDLIGGFNCICQANYTGSRCENASNQCQFHNPCGNGGSCYQIGTKYGCSCTNGFTGYHCLKPTTVRFTGNGYLTMNSSAITASFKFRTTLFNVALCHVVGQQAKHVLIALAQTGLMVSDSSGKQEAVVVVDSLGNGLWHTVNVSYNQKTITITIDSKTFVVTSFGISNITKYYFGGFSPGSVVKSVVSFSGLIGCMQDITLGSLLVDPNQGASSKAVTIGSCAWKQFCVKSPCENGGQCADLWNTYRCKCNRRYYGTDCKQGNNCAYIQISC